VTINVSGSTTSLTRAPLPLPDRVAPLRAVRDFLAHPPRSLMDLLTETATHRAVQYEIDAAVRTLDGAVEEVVRNRPRRVPELAVFMPSNVILYSYVLYVLVPSLYVALPTFRAASQVADQTTRLQAMLAPLHGLPIRQHQVSQRAFLEETVSAVDVVVFTGTYQNAEKIRRQLRSDQLFLFLGAGINPFIVTEAADVERAVRDAVAIRLLNCGQDCLAPDIFFVARQHVDEFVDGVVRELKGARYGPYTDPGADFGPIFYEGALESAALYLCRHRREIVHGGTVDFRSRRMEPAVLLNPFTERPEFTEFFTPVFNVVSYPDEASLIKVLTSGVFVERALGASVYGPAPDIVRALSKRHTVTTDRTLLSIDDGNQPFGGYGPMANYASCGGSMSAKPILLSAAVAEHLVRSR
jgi:hypothetical protein